MISAVSFSAVIQRLRETLGLRSEKEVADALGMKPNAFYNRRRAGSLPYEELVALAEKKRLRTDWLLFGIGEQSRVSKVGEAATRPNVEPELAGMIHFELERAWSLAHIADRRRPEDAAEKGIYAAQIYNGCYLLDDDRERRAVARRAAEDLAAAKVLVDRVSALALGGAGTATTTRAKTKPTAKRSRSKR